MSMVTAGGFVGIDRRRKNKAPLSVASDMRNMRVTSGGALEKRGRIDLLATLPGAIEGLWCGSLGKEFLLLASANGKLYRVSEDGGYTLLTTIGKGKCLFFEFCGRVYIMNSTYYGCYDGNAVKSVEGYAPLVAISCTPNGEGVAFEEINLICDKRRQRFSADGSSLLYKLAEDNIDSLASVKLNGVEYGGNYSLNKASSEVSFETPIESGLNNLEITYVKSSDMRKNVLNCKKAMIFGGNSDGRIFLYGNEEKPNYRYYSALADGLPSAEYFPVNCYTVVGSSPISCIVQQYDRQLIFTKNEAFYSYCQLVSDALGNTVSSFPVFSLNNGKGCLFETDGCVAANRPITLCSDGLNAWESTGIENEKNACVISEQVNEMIFSSLKHGNSLHLADLQAENELFFIANGTAYVYNYSLGAWYIYDSFGGDNFRVYGDKLYFTNGSGIYRFCEKESCCYSALWQSGYIESAEADCDIISLTADIRVRGSVRMKFTIETANGDTAERILAFDEQNDRLFRTTVRTRLRRATPYRVRLYIEGDGVATLYSLAVRTKNKERSRRFGIL